MVLVSGDVDHGGHQSSFRLWCGGDGGVGEHFDGLEYDYDQDGEEDGDWAQPPKAMAHFLVAPDPPELIVGEQIDRLEKTHVPKKQ